MNLVKILFFSGLTWAAQPSLEQSLPQSQVKTFRSWMVTIVEDQISRGANPRWSHRDCAGLVRFAVNESLARHDNRWRKVNGLLDRPLPAEIEIDTAQRNTFKSWNIGENEKSNFVRALPLIQRNTVFIGKSLEHIEPGDLLFFDQGDDQHVMIWTGRRIVYHNGHRPHRGDKLIDNGLRAVSLNNLMKWSDSRWQPRPDNPNFIGAFRLSFLQPPREREIP